MGKFVEVGGNRVFKPWKEWNEGEYVSGKYLSQSEDKFGNPNYAVRIGETNIEGLEVGETLVLNSNGSLNYKMEEVEVGAEILAEYTGMMKLEKGAFTGKDCHTVKLLVAEADGVEADEDDDDL